MGTTRTLSPQIEESAPIKQSAAAAVAAAVDAGTRGHDVSEADLLTGKQVQDLVAGGGSPTAGSPVKTPVVPPAFYEKLLFPKSAGMLGKVQAWHLAVVLVLAGGAAWYFLKKK